MPFCSYDLRACLNPYDPNSNVNLWKQSLEVPISYPDLSAADHFISIIENVHCLCFEEKSSVSTKIGSIQRDELSNLSYIELNIHSLLNKIGYTEAMDAEIRSLSKSIKGKIRQNSTFDNNDQRKLDFIISKYRISFSNLSKKTSFAGKLIKIYNVTDENVPLLLPIPDREAVNDKNISTSATGTKRKLPFLSEKQGFGERNIRKYGKAIMNDIERSIRAHLRMEPETHIKLHRGAQNILAWILKSVNIEFMLKPAQNSNTADLDKAIVDAAGHDLDLLSSNAIEITDSMSVSEDINSEEEEGTEERDQEEGLDEEDDDLSALEKENNCLRG